MNRHSLFALFLLVTVFCSCSSKKVDLSGINEEATVFRYDRLIFTVDPKDTVTMKDFDEKQNQFFSTYTEQIINIGNYTEADFPSHLEMFQNNSLILEAKGLVDSVFANFESNQKQLVSGFKHYKYYFPETQTPKIYTYVSGFNEAIVLGDSFIGVSLDKYLGENCRFYPMLGIHKYKQLGMIPDRIAIDALMGWAMNDTPKSSGRSTLVEEMIYHGKMMYLMDVCFPDASDEVKIGYTPEQLAFCNDREGAMWHYLVEQKLLFNTDRMLLKKFVYPAPFTNPFTAESPGRAGVWIGWQIVRSYMENHPAVSVKQLMKEKGEKQILNEAKYFPE